LPAPNDAAAAPDQTGLRRIKDLVREEVMKLGVV
jgi:hypothetical protein